MPHDSAVPFPATCNGNSAPESGISIAFDHFTGRTRLRASDGKPITHQNVQKLQFDFQFQLTEYVRGRDGELIEIPVNNGSQNQHQRTLAHQSHALRSLQAEVYESNTDEIRPDLVRTIAGLHHNDAYEAWASGDIEFDEFLYRDVTGAEVTDILLCHLRVPTGQNPLEALDELIEAAAATSLGCANP